MYKKVSTLLIILALVCAALPGTALAEGAPTVLLNGQQILFDQPPVIQDGRTLVPLRAIFEALGASIDWDADTATVTASCEGTEISLTVGDVNAKKDGETIPLDVPAAIIGDRTLVPVRFIADCFGVQVGWDAANAVVSLEKSFPNENLTLTTPEIQTFYGGKSAAVSFTFDDGNYDAAVIYNELFQKYGLKGTAMIIANGLTEQTAQQWNTLFADGCIDAGNHSMAHQIRYDEDELTPEQLEEDISGAFELFTEYFPEQQPVTFASPWGRVTDESTAEIKKHHFANRTAGGGIQDLTDPQEDEWFSLPCALAQNTLSVDDMNAWTDQALSMETWYIELWHGVEEIDDPDTPASDGLNLKKSDLDQHLAYVASQTDDIWSGTFNEVTKYIYERQHAEVEIAWSNANNLGLRLTDTLDDERFDFPLTVKVNVPDDWTAVTYFSDGVTKSAEVIKEGDQVYALLNIVPDRGDTIVYGTKK